MPKESVDSISVRGITVKLGDVYLGTVKSEERGLCPLGQKVVVKVLKRVDREPYVGLYSEIPNPAWGSLDGAVDKRHGYWVSVDTLNNSLKPAPTEQIIVTDFSFKKRNLKGMRCKILHEDVREKYSFVELPENVGGGCCDGIGKMGHCIVIPTEYLAASVKEKERAEPVEKKSSIKGGHEKDIKWGEWIKECSHTGYVKSHEVKMHHMDEVTAPLKKSQISASKIEGEDISDYYTIMSEPPITTNFDWSLEFTIEDQRLKVEEIKTKIES